MSLADIVTAITGATTRDGAIEALGALAREVPHVAELLHDLVAGDAPTRERVVDVLPERSAAREAARRLREGGST